MGDEDERKGEAGDDVGGSGKLLEALVCSVVDDVSAEDEEKL